DGGTVTRPNRVNLPAVHRRAVHILANDAMCLFRGPCNVARHLPVMMRDPLGAEAEGSRIRVAGLLLKSGPINTAPIQRGGVPVLRRHPRRPSCLRDS